jgi:hypothetical protein
MAKKKSNIHLESKNITYVQDDTTYKVIALKTSSMTVQLQCFKNDVFIKNTTLPFAHLPKKIKSLVNPL